MARQEPRPVPVEEGDSGSNMYELSSCLTSVLGTLCSLHKPLMEAGLDSLKSASYLDLLSASLSTQFPATTIFDYPTLSSMACHVTESVEFSSMGC